MKTMKDPMIKIACHRADSRRALGGCGSMELKPWVSPYERNNLADPIMSFNRAPASGAYMHHVHQAREGARGAEGGGGGGCGCN